MRPERVRFGFRIHGGPNDGLCSAGWRVWAHGDTTYVTAKSLGDTWKTSLHGEGPWQHAVTKDHLRDADRPVWSEPDRAAWRFAPPPYVDGRRLAFAVAVTRAALLPGELEPSEHVIAVEDRWDRLTSAFVWMTQPGVNFDAPGLFAGPLLLTTGCRVWLQQNQEALDAIPEDQDAYDCVAPQAWFQGDGSQLGIESTSWGVPAVSASPGGGRWLARRKPSAA